VRERECARERERTQASEIIYTCLVLCDLNRAHPALFADLCVCVCVGLVLCDYIRAHPALFADKRILELGAGNGLQGVVLSRLPQPPASITLTDHHPLVLKLMKRNLLVNGVKVLQDWRHDAPLNGDDCSALNHPPTCRQAGASERECPVGPEGGRGGGGDGGISCAQPTPTAHTCQRQEPVEAEAEAVGAPASERSRAGREAKGDLVVRTMLLDWEVCQREAQIDAESRQEAAARAISQQGLQGDTGGLVDLHRLGPVDVILGADVTYAPELATALLCTIKMLLEQDKDPRRVAYISASVRSEQNVEHFHQEIERFGLKCSRIGCYRLPLSHSEDSGVGRGGGGGGGREEGGGGQCEGARAEGEEDAWIETMTPLMRAYSSIFVASEIHLFCVRL